MELVHHREAHVAPGALAQGMVREDLRRAHDDRGVVVHRRIARHHAHVLRAELAHQIEELLTDQRLDGGRVVGALPAGHRGEDRGERDRGLARPGGRRGDHMVAGRDRQQRFLLVRIQLAPHGLLGLDESVDDRVLSGV